MEFKSNSVLILEDSMPDFMILKKMLLELGFTDSEIHWASQLSEFAFKDENFVLCDLNLPDSEGRNTLRHVLNQTKTTDASVIVMTGLSDEALAQESIQMGAQDYLIKGTFSKGVLKKTLLFAFERNRLLSNLRGKQKALIDMEQYLSTILETVPVVIIRFDKNLVIEYLNRPFFGYEKKEMFIGKTLLEFAYESDREMGGQRLHELLSEDKPKMFEGRSKTKDGRIFNVLYKAAPIGDGTYILIATDISELVKSRDDLKVQTQHSQATQLQLLSAQMNPHFLFNALSSIQHSILHNELETSLNFISSFSSLMRKVLENSRDELINWSESKSFLENYLTIEQFRFEGSFDYMFEEDEHIDPEDLLLPPMLVQPYLENTVAHGIASLNDRRGQVWIKVTLMNNLYCISVIDNGVGRQKAIEKRKLRIGDGHISRAMSIAQQRLDLLNTLHDTNDFKVEITDLFDNNGEPSGTRVDIFVPSDLHSY